MARRSKFAPATQHAALGEVADFGDLVLTHHAVFYYEHVDALGIEHDGRVRHDQGRRLAGDLKFDGGIHPWAQFTIGVGEVDLGQQGSRPLVQGVGDACNLARDFRRYQA